MNESKRTMTFVIVLAALVTLLGRTVPAYAIEAVYGGPECLRMRFDFRSDGQVFVTDPAGLERGGTYRDAGDKVAITIPHDPGLVLVRSGDALTLHMPKTIATPETLVRCTVAIDAKTAKSLAPDPRLFGCWQQAGLTIWDQAGAAPREIPPDERIVCQSVRDASRSVSVCRRDGEAVGGNTASYRVIGPNLTTTRIVENAKVPAAVGQEAVQHWTLAGDAAVVVVYGAEITPASPRFKTEVRSRRVSATQCIVKLP